MTEADWADFQENLLGALHELEDVNAIRSQLANQPGAVYWQAADDEMIEVAAELVKTWGKIDHTSAEP
jgi:hypothetical protein